MNISAKNRHEKVRNYKMTISAKAVKTVLHCLYKKNKDETMLKDKVCERAADCAKRIAIEYQLQISGLGKVDPPNIKFIKGNWSDICLHAADKETFYVIPNPPGHVGIREGTLEEYQEINPKNGLIVQGMADRADIRANIILSDGGETFRIQSNLLLVSGN